MAHIHTFGATHGFSTATPASSALPLPATVPAVTGGPAAAKAAAAEADIAGEKARESVSARDLAIREAKLLIREFGLMEFDIFRDAIFRR